MSGSAQSRMRWWLAPLAVLVGGGLTGAWWSTTAQGQGAAAAPAAQDAPAAAGNAAAPPAAEGPASVLARFAEACSAGDAAAVGGLFTDTAELVDETGRQFLGPDQVAGILGELFAAFPQSKFQVEVQSARPVAPGTVVLDAVKLVTTAGGLESRLRLVAVAVDTDAGWKLGSLREYTDPEIVTASAQLKPLEWLVGDWIDESTQGDVQVSCRWSEDGNYLLRTFVVRRAGQVRSKSTQRIGWDPVQKQIRAWHFDGDGGFGESLWSQAKDQWIVRSQTTSADGRMGSAVHVLTPLPGNRVNWKSTFRMQGDVLEPDRESTMVRQPPRPTPPQ